MARLLLVALLVVLVFWIARRALTSSRARRGGHGAARPGERELGAPERLLCGVCGSEFDPEQSGWICPRCGK